jgi:23S rRNA (cytosine1962-C5)-methyltransferase
MTAAAHKTAHEGRVVLRKGRARPLWYGHPWVYANAIATVEGDPAPGDVVSLTDHDGRFIGKGFYNARSQIPVRLCTRADEAVDAAFLRRRIERARATRARLGLPSPETNVYRLVNSEGDDLPGLVIDIYADAAAVQITTLAMSMRRAEIYDALEAELSVKTIYELLPASYAELEGYAAGSRVARGASRGSVAVVENGVALEVEPLGGQKTGMFIDQRETRARVGALAAVWGTGELRSPNPAAGGGGNPPRAPMKNNGARVLDVYAYAGGFALAAARAGAAAVTAVDSSARAVARISAHAAANGVTIDAIEADAFRYLETATPRAFDLVVIDPPKFARARKDLDAARKGYERLNALALQTVSPGGILVTCSCSQNVDAEAFERIVAAGAKQAGRDVKVFERRGPASDHLLPPAFTEGQYLKVLLCHVT